jgi:hypothetical protein
MINDPWTKGIAVSGAEVTSAPEEYIDHGLWAKIN